MPVILVEGNDNTGKTTLIQKLIRQFPGTPLLNNSGPASREEMIARLNDCFQLAEKANKSGEVVMFDRLALISERIYGPIVRGRMEFTPHDLKTYWTWFMNMKPIIIYCRPPLEESLKTLHERPQMDGVVKRFKEIQKAYDKEFKYLWDGGVQFMIYNFIEDPDAHILIGDLKRYYIKEGK